MDSSVIYGDPRLERAYFRLVRQHAAARDFELLIPEVVIREVVAKFNTRAAEAYDAMRKPAEELRRLGLDTGIPAAEMRATNLRDYETHVRSVATAAGSAIAAIPDVPHEKLVSLAIAKEKPFDSKGAGYRDALIWENVAQRATSGPVAFITNNTSDFSDDADETRPALNLVRDLVIRGVAANAVTIFPDMRRFVEAHVPSDRRVAEELNDKVARDGPFTASLLHALSRVAADHALATYEAIDLGVPRDIDDATVEWFEAAAVTIDGVRHTEDDETIVDMTATGEFLVEGFIPQWVDLDEADGVAVRDNDWNEWRMWVEVTRRGRAQVAAVFDPAAQEFDEFEILAIDAG